MLLFPEYGVSIIVLVKYCNSYSWYVSEKEDWVLDYKKWNELFLDDNIIEESSIRAEFPILDEKNWSLFRDKIDYYKVDVQDLKKMIQENIPIHTWNEKGHLFPSLLIDFDSRNLYTTFAESTILEDYVPDGWHAEFKDFYDLIPNYLKYWIVDGVNYFPG